MTTTATDTPVVNPARSRAWPLALASLALLVLLGTLSAGIILSRQQSRSHILSTFALRGSSSATFVSEFLMQQATHEQQAAQQFLAGGRVSRERFRLVVAAFGSGAAMLLDSSGRLLDVVPSDPALIGPSDRRPLRPPHGRRAGQARDLERRALGGARHAGDRDRRALLDPAGPARVQCRLQRLELGARALRGAHGPLSPARGAARRRQRACGRRQPGTTREHARRRRIPRSRVRPPTPRTAPVAGARTPTTFADTPVAGTSWRLLIAVPNSRLYASIAGWTQFVPWLVLALVSILGALLVALFAPLAQPTARGSPPLSATLAQIARTDALDRTAQPTRARRAPRARGRARTAPQRAAVGADDRPRSLQADQRPLRARGGRSRPVRARRLHARRVARRGHLWALGWRRVPRRAAGHR